eukprot:scaffold62909_cov20-Prasinocladus_malaysianus.AAC.1
MVQKPPVSLKSRLTLPTVQLLETALNSTPTPVRCRNLNRVSLTYTIGPPAVDNTSIDSWAVLVPTDI